MITNKTPVDDSPVGGAAMTVKWPLTRHLMLMLEADTDALQPEVPDEFTILEVRPGIGLLTLSILQYATDIFRPGSPSFHELVGVVSVLPDLSIDMPPPSFSFYPISVYSDSVDFCQTEYDRIHTPTYHVPSLDVQWSEDGASASASDERGHILTIKRLGEIGTFRSDVIWGQHFNKTKGGAVVNGRWTGGVLLKGPWEWNGTLFEHQRDGDWGSVSPHHFYGNVDLSRVRGVYRSFVAEPLAPHVERFYEMKPFK